MKKGLLVLGYKDYPEKVVYDVFDAKERIMLKYSPVQINGCVAWNNPNKPAYTLLDTGDFLVFIDHGLNVRTTFNYDQTEALRALLKLNDRANNSTFTHYEKK